MEFDMSFDSWYINTGFDKYEIHGIFDKAFAHGPAILKTEDLKKPRPN
jgi:hypothetical protein